MTGDSLRRALAVNRAGVRAALAEAEAELAECRLACSELEDLVALGRRLSGVPPTGASAMRETTTLHDAMASVLAEFPDGLSAADLTQRVNELGLYRRRDGAPVEPVQVHARASQYRHRFDRRAQRILVRTEPR